MRTWSAEELVIRAASTAAAAVQGLIDAAGKVERMTRPPRRDFDEDAADEYLRDGAEELAEAEESQEVWEPRCSNEYDDYPGHRGVEGESHYCTLPAGHASHHECGVCEVAWEQLADDTPNPTEPGPIVDEWRCVLCREPFPNRAAWAGHHFDKRCEGTRYDAASSSTGPSMHNEADRLCIYNTDGGWPDKVCGVCRPVRDIVEQMIEERFGSALSDDEACRIASEEIRLMRAEKRAQSSAHTSTSAAGAAGDQLPGGLQHSPPLPARERPAWSDLADAIVEHRPSATGERAAIIAVIRGVLARHHPVNNPVCDGAVSCIDPDGTVHDEFGSQREWRAFVAALIAEALAPHRVYVKQGPMGEPVPVELRPDIDIRQHHKHLMKGPSDA